MARQGKVRVARKRLAVCVHSVEDPVIADRAEDRERFVGQVKADARVAPLKPFRDGHGRGAQNAVLRGLCGRVRDRPDCQVKQDRQDRRDAQKLQYQPPAQRHRRLFHSATSR